MIESRRPWRFRVNKKWWLRDDRECWTSLLFYFSGQGFVLPVSESESVKFPVRLVASWQLFIVHSTTLTPMKAWDVLFVWAIGASVISSAPTNERRKKRDLLDLADMLDTLSDLDPADFIPYGNWCGYGGGGETVDRIDRCCEVHDKCYGMASEKKCSDQQVYIAQYEWKKENNTVICNKDQSSCGYDVCECDREVVLCIMKYIGEYNHDNRYIGNFAY